jgi:hypothetical protein
VIPGLLLYVVIVMPPVAAWLEGSMVGHMLVQIPLLVRGEPRRALGSWRPTCGTRRFQRPRLSRTDDHNVWYRSVDVASDARRSVAQPPHGGDDQQVAVGTELLILAMALLVGWGWFAIVGRPMRWRVDARALTK